mmetsp:Transcript_38178/g.34106  ORF Transcript_38178/g.34106 Transcript_38178/m.34106 type:complete len:103 (+) Transcript_38178:173-481(+)
MNLGTENVMKHRLFLGEISLICEQNRAYDIEEFDNEIIQADDDETQYYCDDNDLVFSKIFSIKSYVNNVFGTTLEEGIYKLEKDRLDLIKRRNVAIIEGKHH